jgi:transposase
MRRLKTRYEQQGFGGLRDYRGSQPRRKRIPIKTIEKVCRLKRTRYADFSVRHFHEKITEKHEIEISYNWTRIILQEAGIVEKAPGRGKYRRRRERRPMTGMLIHMDASTHRWIPGLPMHDLNIVLDDADGRILYGEFVEQEGLASTFSALKYVLEHHGRFCELYTDRGSHFCHTPIKGRAPAEEQNGHVSRALKTIGIRQILARSPQARGRSERCFGTIQGRLPQELRVESIKEYAAANRYLQEVFIPDFNRRFTVRPEQRETAFLTVVGIDLDRVLSIQHHRVVRNDNTVTFNGVILQLPATRGGTGLARCPVLVHELTDHRLGISFQGQFLARYSRDGELLQTTKRRPKAA